MNHKHIIMLVVLIAAVVATLWYMQSRRFPIPRGETIPLGAEPIDTTARDSVSKSTTTPSGNIVQDTSTRGADTTPTSTQIRQDFPATTPANTEQAGVATEPTSQETVKLASNREIFVTDNVRHSIPLDEILSGGPGKDGIPSIDAPKFVSVADASYLNDTDPGIGLTVSGESRFYPYRILVWHEIVNDTVQGRPVLVTYCPLCATGVVFDRTVNGAAQEFGVSGMLWQSNLLMYNRAATEDGESLWSQVLGEAVLGVETGERLMIVRSDVVRFKEWRDAHPDTRVLSDDTGAARNYGRDPYGSYYTSDSVSFGATFNDDRLHPKTLVHGIEINGQYKAYADEVLQNKAPITDTFAGNAIRITRTDAGELHFEADGVPLSSIPGFWFSWLAVHPDTELYQ